jgi:hypothetical protein
VLNGRDDKLVKQDTKNFILTYPCLPVGRYTECCARKSCNTMTGQGGQARGKDIKIHSSDTSRRFIDVSNHENESQRKAEDSTRIPETLHSEATIP